MSTHFQVGIFFFLFFPPSTQAAGIANPEPSLSGQTWLMPFVSLPFMHAEQQGALQGTACSVRLVWPSPVSSASSLPATLVQRDLRIRLGHGTRWIPRSNGSEDSSNHPLQSDPTSLGQRGILCSIPAHQPFPALGLGTTAWSAINDDPLLFTGCISQLLLLTNNHKSQQHTTIRTYLLVHLWLAGVLLILAWLGWAGTGIDGQL